MEKREFTLPVCWKDDVRMRVLFSEFRPKDANPEGWQDKMDFWVSLILQWSRETRSPVFSAYDLGPVFERKRSHPACLQTVLAHMKRSGDLSTVHEHFANDGWVKWGFDVLVKKPLTWMWGWGAGGEPLTEDHLLVNVEVLQQLQKQVQKRCEDERFVEDVVLYSHVFKLCQEICKDEKTFAYVLSGLEKAKYLRVFLRDGKKMVQFLNQNADLSEQEKALIKLDKAKQDLNQKVELLQGDINRCTREALEAKKQGFQNKALYILKKRRRALQVLDKQYAMLDNIHSLEMNLSENKDIQAIYDGYKSAAQALKTAHGGLEADDIDDVVAEIHDTIEDQQELGRLMGSLVIPDNTDDNELEEELTRILDDSMEEAKDVHRISDLGKDLVYPEVPLEDPHSPEKLIPPNQAQLLPSH